MVAGVRAARAAPAVAAAAETASIPAWPAVPVAVRPTVSLLAPGGRAEWASAQPGPEVPPLPVARQVSVARLAPVGRPLPVARQEPPVRPAPCEARLPKRFAESPPGGCATRRARRAVGESRPRAPRAGRASSAPTPMPRSATPEGCRPRQGLAGKRRTPPVLRGSMAMAMAGGPRSYLGAPIIDSLSRAGELILRDRSMKSREKQCQGVSDAPN